MYLYIILSVYIPIIDYKYCNFNIPFAVSVENFFERPQAFEQYHPRLYQVLCIYGQHSLSTVS